MDLSLKEKRGVLYIYDKSLGFSNVFQVICIKTERILNLHLQTLKKIFYITSNFTAIFAGKTPGKIAASSFAVNITNFFYNVANVNLGGLVNGSELVNHHALKQHFYIDVKSSEFSQKKLCEKANILHKRGALKTSDAPKIKIF